MDNEKQANGFNNIGRKAQTAPKKAGQRSVSRAQAGQTKAKTQVKQTKTSAAKEHAANLEPKIERKEGATSQALIGQEAKAAKTKRASKVVNVPNSLFGLSLAGITLSIAYILLFSIVAIVLIASTGEYTVGGIIFQVLTILFLVVYGTTSSEGVKKEMEYKKANKFFVVEIILSLLITISMIIGFKSWLTLIAGISLIIISGVKYGLNQVVR